jgi:hypothetical protein
VAAHVRGGSNRLGMPTWSPEPEKVAHVAAREFFFFFPSVQNTLIFLFLFLFFVLMFLKRFSYFFFFAFENIKTLPKKFTKQFSFDNPTNNTSQMWTPLKTLLGFSITSKTF